MTTPVGPYTPAIRAGAFLYTSGQVGLKDGSLVEGLREQTAQSIANLKSLLDQHGANLGQIVKTTVFLTDMASYADFNEAYLEGLEGHRPARSCVAVRALPLGAVVEIEAVAHLA